MHRVKFFTSQSWAREQQADLAHDMLLDRAKSQEHTLSEYHQEKMSRQDSTTFPAIISTSIDAVCSKENHSQTLPFQDQCRYGLTHNRSSHCPASGTQCNKCKCLTHWQHVYHTCTLSRPPSRRDNISRDRHHSRSCCRGDRKQYQKGQ